MIGGVQQKEGAAIAARGEIPEGATSAAGLTELVEQQRAAEAEPGEIFDVRTRLLHGLEERVLVLKTCEGEQQRARGVIGKALCAHDGSGIIGSRPVAGGEDGPLGERLQDVEQADQVGVGGGELARARSVCQRLRCPKTVDVRIEAGVR